jgi:hypothetical protein
MIAVLMLAVPMQAATPAVTILTPGKLPQQALPARGCAAYLWSLQDRSLVTMATADPATLRLVIDGKVVDLPQESRTGPGGFGLPTHGVYRQGGVMATLDLTFATRADLTDGGGVPEATLTVARDGADMMVLPVAGMIGCAPRA